MVAGQYDEGASLPTFQEPISIPFCYYRTGGKSPSSRFSFEGNRTTHYKLASICGAKSLVSGPSGMGAIP
jgi:hypothetical protein